MNPKVLLLFSPSLVKSNPQALLADIPPFIAAAVFVDEINPRDDTPPPIVVVFGRKHKKVHTLTPLQFAVIREATRLGHTVVTNSNFKEPHPRVYSKLSYRDAPYDNTTLGRIFAGAGANEAVTHLDIASDLRPENLATFGAGSPSKSALKLLREHVERLANEREAGGTFPQDFTKEQYLANFDVLLSAMLEEAAEFFGQELSA